MRDGLESEALELLRRLTGDRATAFRADQLEAISALVADRGRVLLVQRTGWGKSAVYFIATRLLRARGLGPTLLVSPLLALMRNQIEAAERLGVRAATINSSNSDEWAEVTEQIYAEEVDVLLISPERLANQQFRAEVLPSVGRRSGLLVIDEAHCISDWGHDFRPDYRRLVRVLDLLPSGVPVLCCTATANDRVIADVTAQLGADFVPMRGTLERSGLRLHAIDKPGQAERLVWLASVTGELPGTGIVYCLTVADTGRVADWLRSQGIAAQAYSGGDDLEHRQAVERDLIANRVKVVVATSALGMGFDKPDLAFVIHFQAPGSPVTYYQQVGRAGRALTESWGILLQGGEDADINDYFIDSAFPAPELAEEVVRVLERNAVAMTTKEILAEVNMRQGRLESLLKILEVEGAVEREDKRWLRTLARWKFDHERVAAVTTLRRSEQKQMRDYISTGECRMRLLRSYLDDHDSEPCGTCDNCSGESMDRKFEPAVVQQAVDFLRKSERAIEARRQFPDGKRIPLADRLEEGRVLAVWGDGGWGRLVRSGKQQAGRFDEQLVEAARDLIQNRWRPEPAPGWVAYVPSLRRHELVRDFARRLASSLGLVCKDAVVKVKDTKPQKTMQNNQQQYRNIADAFEIAGEVPSGPVLLVDDMVDSRWTLTVVGLLLRRAAAGPVFPFALADTAGRSLT
ncbi:MAG: RecQ family ATP-dependent DNA helicase [Acidimicrobiaceae bacterium]|nr:RecQ family ATP-dependent DNA helicase [Acidimicrobiaceae bacterium]MCY4279822.1 RecQ family ATP-dependent DNA helicase [Acidimicrobiaceae bacterium]